MNNRKKEDSSFDIVAKLKKTDSLGTTTDQ